MMECRAQNAERDSLSCLQSGLLLQGFQRPGNGYLEDRGAARLRYVAPQANEQLLHFVLRGARLAGLQIKLLETRGGFGVPPCYLIQLHAHDRQASVRRRAVAATERQNTLLHCFQGWSQTFSPENGKRDVRSDRQNETRPAVPLQQRLQGRLDLRRAVLETTLLVRQPRIEEGDDQRFRVERESGCREQFAGSLQ